jgi:hypothetical protein
MMRLLRRKALTIWSTTGIAALALALPGVAVAGAHPTPQQFCQVQFVAGGPTPAGNSLSVCRVAVPPPAETIVTTFPGTHGGIVVLTRSGAAIVVFH